MSQDYADKEKAFLESLKADTGRDLGEWMLAISSAKLAHRNDIIDWLRHQGFIFSRASWLERIHHNDGQPIYLRELPPSQPAAQPSKRPSLRIVASNPNVITMPKRGFVDGSTNGEATTASGCNNDLATTRDVGTSGHLRAVVSNCAPSPAPNLEAQAEENLQSIDNTIAKAKAFVPLARHIVCEVKNAIPGVTVRATAKQLRFLAPDEFAALVIGAKGLKLCLDLGDLPLETPFVAIDVSGARVGLNESLTHMVVLDDARQIDKDLLKSIHAAHTRVNG